MSSRFLRLQNAAIIQVRSMNSWFSFKAQDDSFTIEFLPSRDRFWSSEIIRQVPFDLPDIAGKQAILTGAGAVWMYAHVAAVLAAARVKTVEVRTPHRPGTENDISQCDSSLMLAGLPGQSGAVLTIQLQSSPALSSRAIDQLLLPRLVEISQLRPSHLTITGRASSEVYARAAYCGVQSGARQISCWSARDGLVVVFDPDGDQLGRSISRPAWMAQAMRKPELPVVIGVTGDPNRGKSVFSTALDWYRDRKGVTGWKLDCDGQAPTAPWYLSLADEQQRKLREPNKRPWTDDMEAIIVHHLKLARQIFSVLIADLPGGNHKAVPPQRLPAGRERMFAEVDLIIIIDRDDARSEQDWRSELREFDLENRIGLVLSSREPLAEPSMTVSRDGQLWRGVITGLDRTKSPQCLGEAFTPALDLVWQDLVDTARRNAISAHRIL